ncbi:MAG: hypothetical protein LQ343_002717 [Gyalolechia ehrenbergii]|nr:MAG: hypothetical protein LQ343_002717 [Gyalolechia ehrenbergii]
MAACSLSTTVPVGYKEVKSRRGRLYYAPFASSVVPAVSPGLLRARIPRPHILRIVTVSPEYRVDLTQTQNHWNPFKITKLAYSRESAKRLLRFVTSSTPPTSNPPDPSSIQPVRSRSSSALINASQDQLNEMAAIDGRLRGHSVGGPVSGMVHRPSLSESVRTASNTSAGSTGNSGSISFCSGNLGEAKPLASANGVSISITLAEPVIFLQGFDQSELGNHTTSMLRGSLHLKVTKNAKIKTISVNFRGRAETEWPEGIPPKKTEFKDKESIMNHTWPFFNAQFQTAEHGSGADVVRPLKGPITSTKELGVSANPAIDHLRRGSAAGNSSLSPKEAKRLSLQVTQSRSFGKGDSGSGSVAQKGYRTFTPGDYIYNFELPIDSRLPETIDVELGRVRYELEATIERAGAFRANLIGAKEVLLIRAPSEGSLEQVEPIAISRNWEDQLHYDIVISGKSFPLGAQVPIAFKLTPLAKIQCHRIKVFLTENIQYYTSNKRVHRLEPTRKVQLFEKRADVPSSSAYPGSSVRITAGGGVAYDGREAAARGEENVPRDLTNLLGNLEGGHNVGPTEMEFSVQLPSCPDMSERDRSQSVHFDTTYHNIQVNHWIKIVMRLSKADQIDPSKRRHFEISIDSPLHILSCRATQANIALPAYTSPESVTLLTEHAECGCPGAERRRNSPSSLLPHLQTLNGSSTSIDREEPFSAGLTRPPAAHLHDPNSGVSRPIHLLRSPSFNPPAFEDTEPPPPMITPPPQYDSIVDGDPRSGLADYFSRLADEVGDDEVDSVSRSRMEVPLTPGGRINRSMDERRTWVPLGHTQ